MIHQPSIQITNDDYRPWLEKWLFMLHHQKRLREDYARRAPETGNLDVETRVTAFFNECYHLYEWLGSDPQVPVTSAQARDYAENSVPLKRAEALCNTYKHHTRRNPKDVTARIRQTTATPNGSRVTVEINWGMPNAVTVDALVLVDECVEGWRDFLKANNIPEPT